MSVAEPNDSDILAALEESLGEVPEPTDIENVQKIPLLELQHRLSSADQTLSSMGELMTPHSQEGRDLHSIRVAILVELSRRGMR